MTDEWNVDGAVECIQNGTEAETESGARCEEMGCTGVFASLLPLSVILVKPAPMAMVSSFTQRGRVISPYNLIMRIEL